MAHILVDMIDRAYEKKAAEEDPFRNHLGGSMIGKVCERELMYSFRWSKRPSFKGRMLRLFERGHKEEFRFVAFLRMIGIEVREFSECLMYHAESDSYMTTPWRETTTPPADPEIEAFCLDVTGDEFHVARAKEKGVRVKQWQISDVFGHFGGSLDGIGSADFPIPQDDRITVEALLEAMAGDSHRPIHIPAGEKFLLEFKTHNTKSFSKLVAEGVRGAKPVHWAQMQIYMHKKGLKFAVYVAVNKNDDDLHIEVVDYDPSEGPKLLAKAERVITARTLPPRVGKHPSWHECKLCDYLKSCHYGEPIDRNCRSCRHSVPVEDGKWKCSLWNAIIPVDAILKGCDSYSVITD